jgi:hypothetical protein
MDRIFSRFPHETVKTAAAFRRRSGRYVTKIKDTLFIDERNASQIWDNPEASTFSAKRIIYFRFPPETRN